MSEAHAIVVTVSKTQRIDFIVALFQRLSRQGAARRCRPSSGAPLLSSSQRHVENSRKNGCTESIGARTAFQSWMIRSPARSVSGAIVNASPNGRETSTRPSRTMSSRTTASLRGDTISAKARISPHPFTANVALTSVPGSGGLRMGAAQVTAFPSRGTRRRLKPQTSPAVPCVPIHPR